MSEWEEVEGRGRMREVEGLGRTREWEGMEWRGGAG